MNDRAVSVVDKPVEEDANTFVTPDTQELMDPVKAIGRRHRQPVVDARQIAQVEDVVKLRRRRRQLANYSPDTRMHIHTVHTLPVNVYAW